MQKWVCTVCGYVYDPAKGDPENGVAAGTPFEKPPRRLGVPGMRREQGRLREELRLIADPSAVAALARECGLRPRGDRRSAPARSVGERLTELRRRGLLAAEAAGGREWEWVLRPSLGGSLHDSRLLSFLLSART